MCSCLLMVNVLIFALPMSSTQIVISGLTGVSIIFLADAVNDSYSWFLFEIMMWLLMPILALGLAWVLHTLIQKKIFKDNRGRHRMIILTPYFISMSFWMMLFFCTTQNFSPKDSATEFNSYMVYFTVLILAPLILLPAARLYMLRRARNMHHLNERTVRPTKEQINAGVNKYKMKQRYCRDFADSLKLWNHQVLLDAYFTSS